MANLLAITSNVHAAPPTRSRRSRFLQQLRRWHGWIGLWGALLGILFGITGILLNHRAILKIPLPRNVDETLQLTLPNPAPADAQALVDWLRLQLNFPSGEARIREEPAHPVAWGDQSLTQPAHWQINLATPRDALQADYWVGANQLSVRRSHNHVLSLLNNLHKGVGLGVGWVLLVDSIAGSLILLSLTGVLLWTQLNKKRLVGLLVLASSVSLSLWIAGTSL